MKCKSKFLAVLLVCYQCTIKQLAGVDIYKKIVSVCLSEIFKERFTVRV